MMYLFQISVPVVKTMSRSFSALVRAGTLGLTIAVAQAQPAPKLTSVSTSWVQRGTTNELVFEGENLTKATRFIFSGEPGVAATRVTGANASVTVEASKGGIYTGDDESKTLRARVVTAADALLGVREVRVVTPAGVSNPLTLNLGFLRELAEVEPNTLTNQAQWLDLPVALNGAIQEATDVDHFRFKAEKGQLLAFDLLANRIGSPLDSSLALLSSDGKELARSEDAIGFDSLIEFTVPETGEYVLQLRDFRFQGGKDYKYRLIAGAVPYLDSIFPLGGRRGQSVDLTLHGRNLDGAGKMNLRITGDAPLGVQEIRARAPGGYSNPRFFEVSDSPEFIEQEPNNEPGKANVVTLPVVINGRIGATKDVDVFRFKAEKDSTYVFEVAASRFGSSMDALLTIMNDKGEVLERNDDAVGADARIERRFGEAGDYLVSVRDLLDRGNEDFGYRLSVRPPVPDFAVKLPGDTVRVNRGSRVAVRVEVSRSAGFGGPIEVAFDQLPPGLSSSPAIIPPELGNGVLILSASADASAGHHTLRINGTSTINGRVATRTAQPLAGDRPVKESFVSILDLAPFTVELLTPSVSLEQEQSATLEAQVIRRNGFMGEIKLVADGFSAGREALTRNLDVEGGVIPAGQNRGTLRLRAKLDSELGTRLMWLRGEATVEGTATVQSSRAIPLTVGQVPFTLANNLRKLSLTVLPPGSKSAAGEAELTIKAARRGWFTDQINLAVEGLPEGVVVSSANLANGVGETVFKLTAAEKAPVGKEISFTILGTATAGGRSYQQRTAPIVLTVNAATPEEGADKKQASK